MPRLAEM